MAGSPLTPTTMNSRPAIGHHVWQVRLQEEQEPNVSIEGERQCDGRASALLW